MARPNGSVSESVSHRAITAAAAADQRPRPDDGARAAAVPRWHVVRVIVIQRDCGAGRRRRPRV